MEGVFRGNVYFAEVDLVGAPSSKARPVVVVSNDVGNRHADQCLVVPVTSRIKRGQPTHFSLEMPRVRGTVLCENIFLIDGSKLGDFVGRLDSFQLNNLNSALASSVGLVTADAALSRIEESLSKLESAVVPSGGGKNRFCWTSIFEVLMLAELERSTGSRL